MVERYYNNDGQLAVLVSHGYGAGWSTWNAEYGIDLAIDKRIVEAKLRDTYRRGDELDKFLESIGYHDVYTGGWADILIHWVDKGTMFKIDEYDGAESLDSPQPKDWCIA